MNPLEILQRTPKTNCGECGHTTCLAFAAAVTRAGADIGSCKYIDRRGLEETVLSSEKDMEGLAHQVMEEQDRALVKHLREKVRTIDFGAIADALGAVWDAHSPDFLSLRYLGRNIRLGKSDIFMGKNATLDPRDQILLYNYVHSCGGRSPDGTWIGMESLPNSISKVKTLETYCEKKIAAFLSGKPEQFITVLGQKLDACMGPPELSVTATSSVVVPALPKVPLFLLFWEEDAEVGIEAKTKILFDHNVLDFLDLESLVFLAERFAENLIRLERNDI